ncbi:hypothetical protein CRG98_003717 [Punica granatum]|uniref:Uncharacterized protein n=1 Tax=Punica granatum TaxID=22663 RepID=A0A2I0L5I9_PUNGR|nr:hypothetical protein CRG98_003717 [Punica granatum]
MAEENQPIVPEETAPLASAYSQPHTAHAPPQLTSTGVPSTHSRAPSVHLLSLASSSIPPAYLGTPLAQVPPPVAQAPPTSGEPARIAALDSAFSQMIADVVELMALFKGPNRTSSSSTSPLGQGPTVDPNPWVLPTYIPKSGDAPTPPTMHVLAVHSVNIPPPLLTLPAAVPPPLMTILTSDLAIFVPPLHQAHTILLTLLSRSPSQLYYLTLAPLTKLQLPETTLSLNWARLLMRPPQVPPIYDLTEAKTEQEHWLRKMDEMMRAIKADAGSGSSTLIVASLSRLASLLHGPTGLSSVAGPIVIRLSLYSNPSSGTSDMPLILRAPLPVQRAPTPQLHQGDRGQGRAGRDLSTRLCRFPSHKSIANFWWLEGLHLRPLTLNSTW